MFTLRSKASAIRLIDRSIRKHPRPVNAHPGLFADHLRRSARHRGLGRRPAEPTDLPVRPSVGFVGLHARRMGYRRACLDVGIRSRGCRGSNARFIPKVGSRSWYPRPRICGRKFYAVADRIGITESWTCQPCCPRTIRNIRENRNPRQRTSHSAYCADSAGRCSARLEVDDRADTLTVDHQFLALLFVRWLLDLRGRGESRGVWSRPDPRLPTAERSDLMSRSCRCEAVEQLAVAEGVNGGLQRAAGKERTPGWCSFVIGLGSLTYGAFQRTPMC
jgi:hypothetical protein